MAFSSTSTEPAPLSPSKTWTPEIPREDSSANGYATTSSQPPPPLSQASSHAPYLDPKSPSAISLRAFLLGGTFGISLCTTVFAASHSSPFWRLPFFLLALSLFHFLEFYTTAACNPSAATVSAFLLSQNGRAYNMAHILAFSECMLRLLFSPPASFRLDSPCALWLGLGFVMIILGQVTRTMAMVQAGSNFNHLVQVKRKEGHVLVTHGIYAGLRHPSYFGFWWWGLGTQVVLGNWICLVGYAVVLWRFFSGRIEKEEELLIEFFGADYVQYRKRTWVGIPFIS